MAQSFEHRNSLAYQHQIYSAKQERAAEGLAMLTYGYKNFLKEPASTESRLDLHSRTALYTQTFLNATGAGLNMLEMLPSPEGAYQANLRLFQSLTTARQDSLNEVLAQKSFAEKLGRRLCRGEDETDTADSPLVSFDYLFINSRYAWHYEAAARTANPGAEQNPLLQHVNGVFLAEMMGGEYSVFEGENLRRHPQ